MSGHAFLSPSAAGSWVHCHAYPSMAEKFPSQDTAASKEGTLAHAVAEAYLMLGVEFAREVPGCTEEMLDGAKCYVDYIGRIIERNGTPDVTQSESKIQVADVHPDRCFGTVDYWMAWTGSKNRLDVIDYKFGRRIVEARENWQLITYAVGALRASGCDMNLTDVYLHIVQPRGMHREGGPIRLWKTHATELHRYSGRLRTAARNATSENPVPTAGDHCQYCPARHACPALAKAAFQASEVATTVTMDVLEPAALGAEMARLREARRIIDTRLSGLQEDAMLRLAGGAAVPGWRIQHGTGRLDWTVDVTDIAELAESSGVRLFKPAEPITPTQAIKAGISPDTVHAMAARKAGKSELVPVADATDKFSIDSRV